ncbi:MAG: hypothetical protein PHE53_11500 [Thermoguttaceae bacterium]|nr:hypothetical protein [Thermoguttaceae bacterium]
MKKWILLLGVVGLCLPLTGCGNGVNKVPISGTIKIGDEFPDAGVIQFDPADGAGPSDGAQIEPGGKFTAEVTAGEKIVRVRAAKWVGEFVPDPVLNPGKKVKKPKDLTNDKQHWASDATKITAEEGKTYDIVLDAAKK